MSDTYGEVGVEINKEIHSAVERGDELIVSCIECNEQKLEERTTEEWRKPEWPTTNNSRK